MNLFVVTNSQLSYNGFPACVLSTKASTPISSAFFLVSLHRLLVHNLHPVAYVRSTLTVQFELAGEGFLDGYSAVGEDGVEEFLSRVVWGFVGGPFAVENGEELFSGGGDRVESQGGHGSVILCWGRFLYFGIWRCGVETGSCFLDEFLVYGGTYNRSWHVLSMGPTVRHNVWRESKSNVI